MTDRICYEMDGGVARITLNRPEALNALENTMIAAIIDFVHAAERDDSVRVVVLSGAGKAFCAGDDLKEMGTAQHPTSDDLFEEYWRGYPAIVTALRACAKPTVCVVQRYALGAGFEIALACDLIIAARDAKFGLPFCLRGIAAGTAMLPGLVGRHRAAKLLLLGDMVSAEELDSWGLVARVCEPESLEAGAEEIIQRLAVSATRVLGHIKAALNASHEPSLSTAFRHQVAATVASALTQDFAEGAQAFVEKRDPVFRGQ